MMPVNTKSMFAILCESIEKVKKNEMDINKAMAIAKLIGQANNLLMYELKRAVLIQNEQISKTHRNIELKPFDCIKN